MFGIDSYEIIRIFNGKRKRKLYTFEGKFKDEYIFKFNMEDIITQKYIRAKEIVWRILKENNCYENILDEDFLEEKFLFSEATMHISDIPCRMIDEKDEEMCICFYLRGLQLLKDFFIFIYGYDPLVLS